MQDQLDRAAKSGDRAFQPAGARAAQSPTGGMRGVQPSRYFSTHAFNRKRTLASGFFNDKQVTRANNKQFKSGLRGPTKAIKKGGRTGGPASPKEQLLNTSRSQLPRAAPRHALAEHELIQAALSGQQPPEHMATLSPRMLAGQASANEATTLQAVASGDLHSPNAQDGKWRGAKARNFAFLDADQNQQLNTTQPQNVSMSVMSLTGLHGQPSPQHLKMAQTGLDSSQYKGGFSPPKSQSKDLRGIHKEAAIQNVTITQRLHGGAFPTKSFGLSNTMNYPGSYYQAGGAGPQAAMIMGGSRPRASGLATVDQKLEKFARQSAAQDSDSTSRFVTFQGEQIGVLKMSLGPDDVSSKNVTFYGGAAAGHQYQHGKVSRNSSLSPQGHHSLKFNNHADGLRHGKHGGLAGQGKPQDGQGPQQLMVEAISAREHAVPRGSEIKGGKAAHGDTLRSRDFAEFNQRMPDGTSAAEMHEGQFGRLGEGRDGNASQKHISKQGVPDYQRKSIGDVKSSLKPFGRRGTQRLDDESLIGLRVGSGILAGEDQGEGGGAGAGMASAAKQGEQHLDPNAAKQAYGMPDRKLQGQDSPPASHAGTLMGKSQKNSQVLAVDARNGEADNQAVVLPQDATLDAAIIDLSRSTERTRTADRSYQKGQGYSNLHLSMTQNAEALNAGVQVYRAANSVNSTDSKSKILAVDEVPNKSVSNRKTGMRDLREQSPDGRSPADTEGMNMELANAQRTDRRLQGPGAVIDQVVNSANQMQGMDTMHQGARNAAGAQGAQYAGLLQLSPQSTQLPNGAALLNGNRAQQYIGISGEQTMKQRAGEEAMHGQIDNRHTKFPSGVNVSLSPLPGDLQQQSSPANSRLISDGTMSGVTGLMAITGGDAQIMQTSQDQYVNDKANALWPNAQSTGVDDEQRNRMAVAIGHREGMQSTSAFQDENGRSLQGDQPAKDKKGQQPQPEEQVDQEQVVLMRILEKMLLRHKLTGMPQRTEYAKFRPRQWETIEDKLCTLDVRSEVVEEDRKNLKKDYVKQIQDHIKEIIRTGKDAKIGTQAAQLEKEQKKQAQRANIGVKLQQLRTTMNSFTAARNLAGNSIGFETTFLDVDPAYHNFNDLRSQSNLNNEASHQILDHQGLDGKPNPMLQSQQQIDDFRQRQPRHSRSVAPDQMLLPSPQAQYHNAALQPVNSQNLMFQSNRDIGLVPKGLKNNASNNLIGAHAQLSSVSFALPLSSSPKGFNSLNKREFTKCSEPNVKQIRFDDKLATDRPRPANLAIRAHTTDLEASAATIPVGAAGLAGDRPCLGDTMQSFISKDEFSSSFLRPERALQSHYEYHSQYNRLDDVIKFKLPVVKKSHLYHPGRGDNERLNEIHAKLRDPAGHLLLMERNAIVQNKHKSSLAAPDQSALITCSRPGFSSFRDSVQSLEPVRRASLLNDIAHEQSAYSTQFLSMQSPKPGVAPPNLLATITQQSKSLMPSTGRLGFTDGQSNHPIEEEFNRLKEKHSKGKQLESWGSEQGQPQHARDLDKRPKISEWLTKEVMLPILGKNKTSLLHSKDQLEIESIAQQTSCINRPFERPHPASSKAQGSGSSKNRMQFGFLTRTGVQGKAGAGGHGGGPKKLSEILKQQEKEMQDQEKAQERHLLRQIEKVAHLMVESAHSKDSSAPAGRLDATQTLATQSADVEGTPLSETQ